MVWPIKVQLLVSEDSENRPAVLRWPDVPRGVSRQSPSISRRRPAGGHRVPMLLLRRLALPCPAPTTARGHRWPPEVHTLLHPPDGGRGHCELPQMQIELHDVLGLTQMRFPLGSLMCQAASHRAPQRGSCLWIQRVPFTSSSISYNKLKGTSERGLNILSSQSLMQAHLILFLQYLEYYFPRSCGSWLPRLPVNISSHQDTPGPLHCFSLPLLVFP